MSRFVYRAGWPSSTSRIRFVWWLRVGPYVVGNVWAWDEGNAE